LATVGTFAKKSAYPKEKLDYCWKKLLLQQFHDVIPGSSIELVYEDCHRDHAEIYDIANRLFEEAIASLKETSESLENVVVFNSLGWERKVSALSFDILEFLKQSINQEIVEVPASNEVKATQRSHNGNSLVLVSVPPFSFQPIDFKGQHTKDSVSVTSKDNEFVFENKVIGYSSAD